MACSSCKKKAKDRQIAERTFKRDINAFIEKLKKERVKDYKNGKEKDK